MKLRLFTFPNILTLCNLLSGCAAVIFALCINDLEQAFWCVLVAAVFDFLDGFAARLMEVSSPVGKELDSLADMISFGLAPASILYSIYVATGGDAAVGLCRVHSGRFFGSAAGEVQSRRASGYRVHRTSYAGLRDVFRFGGVHHAAERCRGASGRSYCRLRRFLAAADQSDTYVRSEVQAFRFRGQRDSAISFWVFRSCCWDSIRSVPCRSSFSPIFWFRSYAF